MKSGSFILVSPKTKFTFKLWSADVLIPPFSSCRILQYLFDNTWFDVYTQAVFVEFTVYNANVNLFCIVTLMLETSGIGMLALVLLRRHWCTDTWTIERTLLSTRGLPVPQRASECASLPGHWWPSHFCHDLRGHLLPLCYILHVYPGNSNLEIETSKCWFSSSCKPSSVCQGKLIKQHRWAYFKNKWNLLECAIILLSWSALSVFIKRTLLGKRDIEYYQNNKDQ